MKPCFHSWIAKSMEIAWMICNSCSSLSLKNDRWCIGLYWRIIRSPRGKNRRRQIETCHETHKWNSNMDASKSLRRKRVHLIDYWYGRTISRLHWQFSKIERWRSSKVNLRERKVRTRKTKERRVERQISWREKD